MCNQLSWASFVKFECLFNLTMSLLFGICKLNVFVHSRMWICVCNPETKCTYITQSSQVCKLSMMGIEASMIYITSPGRPESCQYLQVQVLCYKFTTYFLSSFSCTSNPSAPFHRTMQLPDLWMFIFSFLNMFSWILTITFFLWPHSWR